MGDGCPRQESHQKAIERKGFVMNLETEYLLIKTAKALREEQEEAERCREAADRIDDVRARAHMRKALELEKGRQDADAS